MQDVHQVRNTIILGHGNSGKTTLAEALLATAGAISRMGKVDEGHATLDYEPEETKRHISINTGFGLLDWKKHQVFLMDAPGDDNFFNEAVYAAAVADSAILAIGAVVGVRSQTEKFVELASSQGLPCLVAITRMDKERANFTKVVQSIRDTFTINPVVIHMPIGSEDDFKGVVDLVGNTAWMFTDKGKVKAAEIPAELADEAAELRESLMEAVAETDDDLIEKFLEEGELTDADLREGLAKAVRSAAVAPVIPCASIKNFGSSLILDAIADLLPSPADRPARMGAEPGSGEPVERPADPGAPFSAQVFKTMADPFAGRLTIFRVFSGTLSGDSFYNATQDTSERFGQIYLLHGKEQRPVDQVGPGMIAAVAKLKDTVTGDTLCDAQDPVVFDPIEGIEPVMAYAVSASKDEEKLFAAISRLLDEDPGLRLVREQQTGETLIYGMGQVHLDVVAEKLKRKFGVEMDLKVPKVPYRETIRGTCRVQGRHKKQTGGRGQFGDCWIEMEPLPRGEGFEFIDQIVGGVIPQQYRPAVEKGILEAMEHGPVAGYPFVDVRIRLVDGSYHTVDSSEMAFKVAGSLAFKKGVMEADPVLLEPIMEMEIRVPKDCVGDVMGDLSARRGKVLGMDSQDRYEVIKAHVPQAEILLYAIDLTSMTGGRGSFSVNLSHYEEVPAQLQEKIIEESKTEE